MAWQTLLLIAPLVVLLGCAAAIDLRWRRIPNWLTLAIAITGVAQSFTWCARTTPGHSFLGLLLGGGLLMIPYLIGAVGGGDVKLLAGVGAWLGAAAVFQVFIFEAVIGMVLIVGQCAWGGRLRTLLSNSAMIVANLAHFRELGVDHARATGSSCRSVDRPLPMAVPILLSVILVVIAWQGR